MDATRGSEVIRLNAVDCCDRKPSSLHVVTQAFSPNVHHFPWYRGLRKTVSLVKFQSAMVRSADPISEERIIKEV